MTYKEFIEKRKETCIGKTVLLDGKKYTVVDVDYNGMLLINKPADYTYTTAISILDAWPLQD